MFRFILRTLLVASVLIVPSFMQGGRLVFVPFFAVYNWTVNALFYHQPDIGPRSASYLVTTIALLLAVPVAVALWMRLGDMLRDDVGVVKPRSKVIINLVLAAFSCIGLFIAMAVSDANQGPIMVWGSDMFSYRSPVDTLLGTALLFVAIEQLTYWGGRLTSRLRSA